MPQSIGSRASPNISVSLSLQEKFKFGGYRCISFKLMDTTGGDFVENPEYTILVLEPSHKTVVAEIHHGDNLMLGPEGCYKLIEIGVNHYDPALFRNQSF